MGLYIQLGRARATGASVEIFRFKEGSAPLLVSMPHGGTYVPEAIAARLSDAARGLPDTDWHVARLYDFLDGLGAWVIEATHSRYVIDLNRPPDGQPLYPYGSETELCPTSSFDEAPLYGAGQAPGAAEIAERRARYWQPYHDRLAETLDALAARHGRVLLWDAHTIRSHVPRFFAGRLPDLNLGAGGGRSADPALIERVGRTAAEAAGAGYSHAVDGRFKGGYITRHYGRPGEGRHALQLELSQASYMNETPPYAFRDDLAKSIRPVLRHLMETALNWIQT